MTCVRGLQGTLPVKGKEFASVMSIHVYVCMYVLIFRTQSVAELITPTSSLHARSTTKMLLLKFSRCLKVTYNTSSTELSDNSSKDDNHQVNDTVPAAASASLSQ